MIQLKTTHKVKTILLSVCVLFSVSLFAQSEKAAEKSTIVMTKEELKSFLTTVADARRAQLQSRESKQIKKDLADLKLKYQEQSRISTSGYDNVSNQQILNELRYLNQRIDNPRGANNYGYPSSARDNSTIIMPGNSVSNPGLPLTDRNSTTLIPSNRKKVDELQRKIDSIKYADANRINDGTQQSFGDSLNMMKGRLSAVRRHMDSLESKMNAANKEPNPVKAAEEKSYFKQQVYFDNNSETLRGEYYKYIQDLTQILITYPEAKVMLEGWASPVGKATYNKQLSMRRAEAVQKAFANNRIDPSRILTAFKGEDKSGSAQHARRVDMSIIVR